MSAMVLCPEGSGISPGWQRFRSSPGRLGEHGCPRLADVCMAGRSGPSPSQLSPHGAAPEAKRARHVGAFGHGALGHRAVFGLPLCPGLTGGSNGGHAQSHPPRERPHDGALVAQDPTNMGVSGGLQVVTARGRFAEAFPKGPYARAGTHGAGLPPLECSATMPM